MTMKGENVGVEGGTGRHWAQHLTFRVEHQHMTNPNPGCPTWSEPPTWGTPVSDPVTPRSTSSVIQIPLPCHARRAAVIRKHLAAHHSDSSPDVSPLRADEASLNNWPLRGRIAQTIYIQPCKYPRPRRRAYYKAAKVPLGRRGPLLRWTMGSSNGSARAMLIFQ